MPVSRSVKILARFVAALATVSVVSHLAAAGTMDHGAAGRAILVVMALGCVWCAWHLWRSASARAWVLSLAMYLGMVLTHELVLMAPAAALGSPDQSMTAASGHHHMDAMAQHGGGRIANFIGSTSGALMWVLVAVTVLGSAWTLSRAGGETTSSRRNRAGTALYLDPSKSSS
jgi:hypothetical protein